eukprot:1186941-Prorocentrum_minimum.AAC.2
MKKVEGPNGTRSLAGPAPSDGTTHDARNQRGVTLTRRACVDVTRYRNTSKRGAIALRIRRKRAEKSPKNAQLTSYNDTTGFVVSTGPPAPVTARARTTRNTPETRCPSGPGLCPDLSVPLDLLRPLGLNFTSEFEEDITLDSGGSLDLDVQLGFRVVVQQSAEERIVIDEDGAISVAAKSNQSLSLSAYATPFPPYPPLTVSVPAVRRRLERARYEYASCLVGFPDTAVAGKWRNEPNLVPLVTYCTGQPYLQSVVGAEAPGRLHPTVYYPLAAPSRAPYTPATALSSGSLWSLLVSFCSPPPRTLPRALAFCGEEWRHPHERFNIVTKPPCGAVRHIGHRRPVYVVPLRFPANSGRRVVFPPGPFSRSRASGEPTADERLLRRVSRILAVRSGSGAGTYMEQTVGFESAWRVKQYYDATNNEDRILVDTTGAITLTVRQKQSARETKTDSPVGSREKKKKKNNQSRRAARGGVDSARCGP